jgi:hypothetical protein
LDRRTGATLRRERIVRTFADFGFRPSGSQIGSILPDVRQSDAPTWRSVRQNSGFGAVISRRDYT